MVACWQMEDNVNDATENMMDGAVGGSANYIEGGMQGQKALRLTASANQYVQLPYEVANSDELTVSLCPPIIDGIQKIFSTPIMAKEATKK